MATNRPVVPSLSPLQPTHLICYGCGNNMRRKIERFANGKLSRILFYCDQCQFGYEPSMIHAPGQNAKYEPPKKEQKEESVAKDV